MNWGYNRLEFGLIYGFLCPKIWPNWNILGKILTKMLGAEFSTNIIIWWWGKPLWKSLLLNSCLIKKKKNELFLLLKKMQGELQPLLWQMTSLLLLHLYSEQGSLSSGVLVHSECVCPICFQVYPWLTFIRCTCA